jgi:hypothetical protein
MSLADVLVKSKLSIRASSKGENSATADDELPNCRRNHDGVVSGFGALKQLDRNCQQWMEPTYPFYRKDQDISPTSISDLYILSPCCTDMHYEEVSFAGMRISS